MRRHMNSTQYIYASMYCAVYLSNHMLWYSPIMLPYVWACVGGEGEVGIE